MRMDECLHSTILSNLDMKLPASRRLLAAAASRSVIHEIKIRMALDHFPQDVRWPFLRETVLDVRGSLGWAWPLS